MRQLTLYQMRKLFTVKTDHKDMVCPSNLSMPKLVRWRVLLSEFRFLIQHIPGVQNVVADGLTRVMSLSSVEIPTPKRHMYVQFYRWSSRLRTHFKGSIFGDHGWAVMRRYVTLMISECPKIKYQWEPNWSVDQSRSSYVLICGYAGSFERRRFEKSFHYRYS